MYDVAVIGSGWGGFNAAYEAARQGLSVVLIEKDILGGTCLNYGCIPTKTLVASAAHLYDIRHSSEFGIDIDNPRINFEKILARKEAVISRLRQGIEGLIKAKKINFICGAAKLLGPAHIAVADKVLEAKNIVIASGSRPRDLANLKFDGHLILSSTQLLNLKTIPKSLLIIGGGIIGCEFANIYAALGVKVTIVEILERILITEDKEVSLKLQMLFKKRGIEIFTGKDFSTLDLKQFERVLLCVGRNANVEDLGLEGAGVQYEKNRICVDEYLRTNIANIYAVGDCNGNYQLAHVAAYQGRLAIENMLGKNKKCDLNVVPSCIFTNPEIASVGLNYDAARQAGYNVKVGKFSFLGLGMAHIKGETDGFVKIVANAQNEEILGAVIFGLGATELISVLSLAIKNKLTISNVRQTIFAHPTLSESIYEAIDTFHAAYPVRGND